MSGTKARQPRQLKQENVSHTWTTMKTRAWTAPQTPASMLAMVITGLRCAPLWCLVAHVTMKYVRPKISALTRNV